MRVADAITAAAVHAYFARSCEAAAAFFETEANAIAAACESLAERFARGGTLFVLGSGAQATDAQHVSVEFVHPIVVGKHALPAISLTSDTAVVTAAISTNPDDMFAAPLRLLIKPEDIVFALCSADVAPPITRALGVARDRGALTFLFTGDVAAGAGDVNFSVRGFDPLIVQEIHETLYHVLWELVHVFLDHATPPPNTGMGIASEQERALYPFLFEHASPPSLDGTRHEVRQSILAKSRDICVLRGVVDAGSADLIAQAGRAIATRVQRGGRLLAFGNGGSATDAQDAVADCMVPPIAGWKAIPALALTNDIGVLTAVANDVGFEHVFARQVVAFGRPDDTALGISTSGMSRSVLVGLEAARMRGLRTIALAGNNGGALARSSAVDFCLTAPSDYTPRIQEAQATIWHAMLSVAQDTRERA
jgi:D-sedoheptulose 7-phosphate isomerase